MKTDSLFFRIFKTFPSAFFDLIDETDPRTATYAFTSQEVKQTAFRIDGIFMPPPRLRQFPIYFVEAQAYREEANFYYRFFGEIHLYLRDYQPAHPWQAVVIFTEKRFDPELPECYSEYQNNPRLQRIYLNRLPQELGERTLGLALLQLLVTKQKQAPAKGRALIERSRQELTDVTIQRNLIELIEIVFVYKFPELNFQEIGNMLGLGDLKQTRAYREAQEDILEKTVPLLLQNGMTVEQIAQHYNFPIETIRQFVQPEAK
ncbi:MAG: Rpn family recombination-promoting nuclease/putative transposase [Leptolyngbyaceae cyanobacterium CSU_1_3]|nr:Rpn family recombination-promoting nuclease/putative transposase [Leptolyngbyaceae cyanobacterium CSU_1_3]